MAKVDLKCPDCGSKSVMFTKKNNSYWCRHCGFSWKKEVKKEA